MSTSSAMRAWGIVDPDTTTAAAQRCGLDLALACALLEQESGGGANVWGHDPVDTGHAYVKGLPVTQRDYLAYRTLVQGGKIGRQGVGPCQLTSAGYQDAADQRGGCWDPMINMITGFAGLADLVHRYGLPDGIRRYNGSGPAAEHYRDQVLAKLAKWTDRLGPPVAPVPPPEDDDMQPDERAALFAIRDALTASGIGKGRLPGRSQDPSHNVPDDAFGWILSGAGSAEDAAAFASHVGDRLTAMEQTLTAIAGKIMGMSPGGSTKL